MLAGFQGGVPATFRRLRVEGVASQTSISPLEATLLQRQKDSD